MFRFYTIHSKDILDKLIGRNSSIKLSSAFNLNDPYELKFNLELNPLEEGQEELFYKNNPGTNDKDFANWQNHVLKNTGYTWYAEQMQRNAIAQHFSLCSFTEKNDNNLMWSHYTNVHEGICVEYKPELFEYLKTMKNYITFWKVKYSDIPPTVKSMEDINSKVEKMMFNKQSEWKYEKEHRVVFISNKNIEFIPISPQYIKAVYIGSRTKADVESTILSICKEFNINVYYAITLGDSYEINFQQRKEGEVIMRTFWE
jgi:hypothetical protein